MKILVFKGSPKKKSDTFRLTEAFLKGMNKNNEHEIKIIDVIEKNIAPCRGCFSCWKNKDGHCVIDDDQNEILDIYTKVDLMIWSFPLYVYSMPSHLKAVVDRTIPLLQMKMVEDENGRVRHVPLADFSKLHTLVISGCGFPNWEGNFKSLREMCKVCFHGPDTIFVPETPLINSPYTEELANRLLEKFEKAGEEYSASLSLSPQTLEELEKPMIPKAEYLRHVNNL